MVTRFLQKQFWVVLLSAIILGFLFPNPFPDLGSQLRYLVMVMFFLVMIKMNIASIVSNLKNIKKIALIVTVQLVVLPVFFYYLLLGLDYNFAMATFLVLAIPAATATSSLIDIVKGDTSLSASITVIHALVGPFTLAAPLAIITYGIVDINPFSVLLSLVLILFSPIILSQIFRKYLANFTRKLSNHSSSINVIILFFIIYIPVSAQKELFLENIDLVGIWLVAACILFIIWLIIGYFLGVNYNYKQRLAVSFTTAFANLALAIAIATEFFSVEVLLAVVIYEVPWALILAPFPFIQPLVQKTFKH